MHWIRVGYAILGIAIPCVAAHAASLNDWQQKAIGVVIKFEGSSYEEITTDFDCQGLTIGKGQWTFERNSVKALFDEVALRMGEAPFADFLRVLEAQEPGTAPVQETLNAAIAAARGENTAEGLRIVRSWQQQMRDGQWGLLAEGDCQKGHTRSSEVRLIPDSAPVTRLKAFLLDPRVAAAQEALLSVSADMALERAACWAKISRGVWRPEFFEFLFFYDYLIQNGARWISDSELFDVVDRFDIEENTPARDDRYMRPKMQQVRDWLRADFPYIREAVPAGFLAHAQYAARNATTWFDLYEAGNLDTRQVKLLYVGLLRAILGNNVFGYVAMNRRGTLVTGQGVVNNTFHDFTQLYRESGEIDESELKTIRSKIEAKNAQKIADLKSGQPARMDVCLP